MYGLGLLAFFLIPLLTRAAPLDGDDFIFCCVITSKADFPVNDPNEYFKVPCTQYEGKFHSTEQDIINGVWRAECHEVINPPYDLHEVPLGVINVDSDFTNACLGLLDF
ncbi:uncharacterized protein IWZ02DRAFT_493250 [Phyllosticta citriasiana]|uniref:uncharacterized protein n=1 Tax=Phyllosticta citriasiana TaxID=595635 RepID=UPI0030FD8D55